MSIPEPWKTPQEIDAVLATMGGQLRQCLSERGIGHPLMIGIHTGGVWIAQRLARDLGLRDPLGTLDISFYRDDFTRIGMHPVVRPSALPVGINDRHLILVDDVLHTGRTIRAALNVLFDYGRPASVLLVALAQRDGRELPIAPDVVGWYAKLAPTQHLKLTGPVPLTLVIGAATDRTQRKTSP